jgi:large subunit ribosomal protein L18
MRSTRELREKRHARIRKTVFGTSERPRLSVFRSLKHVYAQIVDDSAQATLVSASTLDSELKEKAGANIEAAKAVGNLVAKRAIEKGIKRVVFDRGGYQYHGRIKSLADAAREAGLDF